MTARNGTADILQNPTSDHAQAGKALRLPLGDAGASGSPYFSVVDLIKRWPEGAVRREILMVSDGIDRFGGGGPSNPYVDSAIEEAQRAGVIIYSIYTPGVGHYGHSFWRMNWGQNYLSQISDETGGETYYLGFGAPVSLAPYLDDLKPPVDSPIPADVSRQARKKGWVPIVQAPYRGAECGVGRSRQSLRAGWDVTTKSSDYRYDAGLF